MYTTVTWITKLCNTLKNNVKILDANYLNGVCVCEGGCVCEDVLCESM